MLAMVAWMGAAACVASGLEALFDGEIHGGLDPGRFWRRGEVAGDVRALVLNMGMLTGVNYTNPIPTVDYEVELEARRVVSSDFFCGLTFPVKSDFATLIIGGWGGSVIGISSLDGEDAAHNETTGYQRFEAGRWVQNPAQRDGDQSRPGSTGSGKSARTSGTEDLASPGDIELSKPFGIATYSTTAELKNIRPPFPEGRGRCSAKAQAIGRQ